jgi:glycosyltransferase involved in cell wall biosynthesis
MSKPIVSVIVCTYNRAGLLTKCLNNLVAQTLDPALFEIIVVNNNSIDDTPQAADAFNSKFRNFRCVFEKNQGLSYARNRGIDEAHGEYLVYLDDDALAPPEYLSNLVNVIKTHRPDFVGGPVYPYYISEKPAWFRDIYETRKQIGRAHV